MSNRDRAAVLARKIYPNPFSFCSPYRLEQKYVPYVPPHDWGFIRNRDVKVCSSEIGDCREAERWCVRQCHRMASRQLVGASLGGRCKLSWSHYSQILTSNLKSSACCNDIINWEVTIIPYVEKSSHGASWLQ